MDLHVFISTILQTVLVDVALAYPFTLAASLAFMEMMPKETWRVGAFSGALNVIGKTLLAASANGAPHIIGIHFLMSLTAIIVCVVRFRKLLGHTATPVSLPLWYTVTALTVLGCSMAYMPIVALSVMPTGGIGGLAISLTISTSLMLLGAIFAAILYRRIPKLAWIGVATLLLLLLKDLFLGLQEILTATILFSQS